MENIRNSIEYYADTIEEAVGHKKEFMATIENFEKAIRRDMYEKILSKNTNGNKSEKIHIWRDDLYNTLK